MRPICRIRLQTVFTPISKSHPRFPLNTLPNIPNRIHKSPFSRQFSISLLRCQESSSKFNSTPPTSSTKAPSSKSATSNQPPSSTPKSESPESPPQPNKQNQKEKDREKEDDEGFNHQIDNAIGEARELQTRTPWHREGSDEPPVKRARSAGAMTKGNF